jgi:hypothetical protein
MAFYDLAKHERTELVEVIKATIFQNLRGSGTDDLISYFADEDTYIRKAAYLSIGRIYFETSQSAPLILKLLKNLLQHDDFKVRQTTINAAGEIGKRDFEVVEEIFSKGLFDQHHSPRNAVIGSIKKMAEVNPVPVLNWAKKFLHHPDKEIRREICHGIELRGRKHPQDILPLLKELEFDKTTRVRNTLVHVIGQIAYKKGCLEIVVDELKNWQNQKLVIDALEEIIDVHHRYRNFSVKTQEEARQYIQEHFGLILT